MNLKNSKIKLSVLALMGLLLAALGFVAEKGNPAQVANASAPIANAPIGGSTAAGNVNDSSAPLTTLAIPLSSRSRANMTTTLARIALNALSLRLGHRHHASQRAAPASSVPPAMPSSVR